MIYISIDNDYHTSLAVSIIQQAGLRHEDVMFISQIAPRNNDIKSLKFARVDIPGHPLSSGRGYLRMTSYSRSIPHQRMLNRLFDFTAGDTLLILTEYQLNNALLARNMAKVGGQVLVFDEGVGFYFNNSPYHEPRNRLHNKFYLLIYNLAFKLLEIPARAKKGQESRMYVCVRDSLVDRIYSSIKLPINRDIAISGYRNELKAPLESHAFDTHTVLMFASNFQCFDLKDEEMALAAKAVRKMSETFDRVFIKVHPSDVIAHNDVFRFYEALQCHNVTLTSSSQSAIDAVRTLKPSTVVGSMSAALFDALLLGCQPIFLFHLLPEVEEFGVYKYTLTSLNYRFITSISEISPDYRCGIDISDVLHPDTLLDIQSPALPSSAQKMPLTC